MLTSYELCWNPSLGTWDVSGASAWNASGENEFGTCRDPDLAGVGFLSLIVGLWRSWERVSMAWKRPMMGTPSLMTGLLDSTPRIPLPISMIGAFLCTNSLCSLPVSRSFTATIFETKASKT